MNKKYGFTLVELLVTMVILGIIVGMSFPLIRRIREANEKREYRILWSTVCPREACGRRLLSNTQVVSRQHEVCSTI